jgi:hypothetical protein
VNKDHRYSDTDTGRGMLLFLLVAVVWGLVGGALVYGATKLIDFLTN